MDGDIAEYFVAEDHRRGGGQSGVRVRVRAVELLYRDDRLPNCGLLFVGEQRPPVATASADQRVGACPIAERTLHRLHHQHC